MIERVIENWLTEASEKSFQLPFCHLLAFEGYTVLHLSRHCTMEMGKDVIAKDADGLPVAFQLKATGASKVSSDHWRTELMPQVNQLVLQAIQHPAIDSQKRHRSVLVVNGELEEEASAAITQYNQALQVTHGDQTQLEVILRGDLYRRFIEMKDVLVPSELRQFRDFLNLYLLEGNGRMPRDRFSSLMESLLIEPIAYSKKPELARRVTAAALASSLAAHGFQTSANHVALIEVWTNYCAHILCVAEKAKLPKKHWEQSVEIGLEGLKSSLAALLSEMERRNNFVEGDPLADVPMYRIRLTHLLGLISLCGLWLPDERDRCEDIVRRYLSYMILWGEYAVPQFLAVYLFLSKVDATLLPADLLRTILNTLQSLATEPESGLAGAEVGEEEYIQRSLKRSSRHRRTFGCTSRTIEGILHLYTRHNRRQSVCGLWSGISKVQRTDFEPKDKQDYYRFRVEEGSQHDWFPSATQSWSQLRLDASESAGEAIPILMKRFPLLYLSFLMMFPHRFNSSGVRWLDTVLPTIH